MKKNEWNLTTHIDFRYFRGYLNSMTYYNFKHIYRTKNKVVEDELQKMVL